ncbi:MAG: DUF1385 domain-containing protein [Oscillospiraceae bacterium]|nr:DUF1385 domain-containing protein [Oscillospiraceae bacterium]
MSENNEAVGRRDFRTSIGGQALIEGIMMRGPSKQAVVVRTADGLVTKVEEIKLLSKKYPVLGWFLVRGVVNFINSMTIGVRALMFSADQMPEEEQEEPTRFEAWIERKFGSEKAEKALISFAVFLGIAFSVGLFILLPTFLAGFLTNVIDNQILRNLAEGVLRITIFVTYLWLTSRLGEIKRVWAYHGAEHKAIACYEQGLPLTVENVRQQPKQHPRCGTSFLFIVMIVSILVFSFTTWDNLWMRIALRLLLLPVVVSISYEIIKLAGRYDNLFTRIISAPGKALQRLTTSEPDDEMMEVAIEAITLVIPEDDKEAAW